MWLVNCNTLKLENFIGSNIPAYAILSHTWEEDEVSFQELDGLCPGSPLPTFLRQDIYESTPKGYHKIYETCRLALERGLQYAWIDTCCINKESSAELTESINSMFKWYQNAVECYAFLSDLPSAEASDEKARGLGSCRWFTRGWTLQELIAPKEVRFYNNTWTYAGNREEWSSKISCITNINEEALLGVPPEAFSVATRMSWASRRETTRIEDLSYSLFGLFQVNMPLIYGEGPNAFLRLQEEIIKRSNDLTILAWNHDPNRRPWEGVLAQAPAAFAESKVITCVSRALLDPVFALTNKGLRFDNFPMPYNKIGLRDLSCNTVDLPQGDSYFIPLGYHVTDRAWIAKRWIILPLRKIGPNYFARHGNLVSYFDSGAGSNLINFHLHTNIWNDRDEGTFKQREVISFVRRNFQVQKVVPESYWDRKDLVFFLPPMESRLFLAVSGAIRAVIPIPLIVCIERGRKFTPECIIIDPEKHNELSSLLFSQRRFAYDATWDDIKLAEPEISQFTNQVEVIKENTTFLVTASVCSSHQASRSLRAESELEAEGCFINFQVEVLTPAGLLPTSMLNHHLQAREEESR